ncbi:3478_t:CDS:2, partial [Gigaspora rosea]
MSDVELSTNEQIINDQNTQSSNDEQEMGNVELSANGQIINDQNTQSSNEEQEMSDVELCANEQILNDQMLNNTKIVNQESLINYKLNFQETNENTSDYSELLTDSNSVSNSESDENYHATIQLSPRFPEALKLLEIKAHSNMINEMYCEIMNAFSEQNISLYCATKKLSKCPVYGEERYKRNSKKVGIKRMAFFPLKDRFIIQYQNPNWSLKLQYQANYIMSQKYLQHKSYGDIFDGRWNQELVEGHFMGYRDIASIASID